MVAYLCLNSTVMPSSTCPVFEGRTMAFTPPSVDLHLAWTSAMPNVSIHLLACQRVIPMPGCFLHRLLKEAAQELEDAQRLLKVLCSCRGWFNSSLGLPALRYPCGGHNCRGLPGVVTWEMRWVIKSNQVSLLLSPVFLSGNIGPSNSWVSALTK